MVPDRETVLSRSADVTSKILLNVLCGVFATLWTLRLEKSWVLGAALGAPSPQMPLAQAPFPPPRYLMKFLARLAEEQEVNKMTPSNIAIVLGPNLLWSPEKEG